MNDDDPLTGATPLVAPASAAAASIPSLAQPAPDQVPDNQPRDARPSGQAAAIAWRGLVAPYLLPSRRRSLTQLLTTGLPYLAVMTGMLIALHYGVIAAMLLLPVGAVLLVRLFIIQHDCGHGSYFASVWANGLLGRALSLLTMTPYTYWRRDHAMHHATTGNLDRRGAGDVTLLTLAEYRALSAPRRIAYRLYRHPLVMFGIGPAWLILWILRVPRGNPWHRWRDWLSIVGTDAALAALVTGLLLILGPLPVLLGWLPVMLLSATIGVWLFYVQHQFEDAYWEAKPAWDFQAAALHGSSFYDLPRVLHWLTGDIGFHHIHHLASRIPNYRLRECHEANPTLRAASRLTLLGSLRCARLALWDAEHGRLVPFRAAADAPRPGGGDAAAHTADP